MKDRRWTVLQRAFAAERARGLPRQLTTHPWSSTHRVLASCGQRGVASPCSEVCWEELLPLPCSSSAEEGAALWESEEGAGGTGQQSLKLLAVAGSDYVVGLCNCPQCLPSQGLWAAGSLFQW